MRKQSEAAFDGATLALPELSATATEFVHQHPEEARVAVTAALEAVAAHFDSARNESSSSGCSASFVVKHLERMTNSSVQRKPRGDSVFREPPSTTGSNRDVSWLAPHASGHTDPGRTNPRSWRTGPGIDRVLEVLPEPRAAWRFLKEDLPFSILHSVRSMLSRPARSMTLWRLRGPRAKHSHDCPILARAGEGSLAAAFTGRSTSHCVETLSVRSSGNPSLEIPVLRRSDLCCAICRWRLCHGIR